MKLYDTFLRYIYTISDFFCSLVLILLHETTYCNKVICELYKMSFLSFTANQNIMCKCKRNSKDYQILEEKLITFFIIFLFNP